MDAKAVKSIVNYHLYDLPHGEEVEELIKQNDKINQCIFRIYDITQGIFNILINYAGRRRSRHLTIFMM